MADFSRFGTPSKEWQGHVEKYGPPPEAPIGKQPAVMIQKSTNRIRDQASEKQMNDEGLSSKVEIQTVHIHARDNFLIPTRIYSPKKAGSSINRPKLPIYVFYHGGGFIYGTLDSEDATCSRITAAMDIVVVNVCYRHTPQHPFPAAHNDALDAFDWITENAEDFGGDAENVIVGGVSAGANLAISVALSRNSSLAREYDIGNIPAVKGLVLVTPWLVIDEEKISYEGYTSKKKASRFQCANAPVVSSKVLKFFVECMGDGVRESGDVDADVGLVSREKLRVLPSTTIMVAGSDPLRDEGIFFAQRLQQNGVPVKLHVFHGLPHGFRRFEDLPSSRRWDELVVESIEWSLGNPKSKASSENLLRIE